MGRVNVLSVVCFSVLISLAFGENIATQNLTLTAASPSTFPLTVKLLGSTATLKYSNPSNINTTIRVCGKKSANPAPNPSSWSSSSCNLFVTFNTTSGDQNSVPGEFDLVPGNYVLGFSAQAAFNGSAFWSGTVCNNGNFGLNCAFSRTLKLGATETFDFSTTDRQYARIKVENDTLNSKAGKQVLTVSGSSEKNYKLAYQYTFGNSLFANNSKAAEYGNQTLDLPVADSSDYYYLMLQPVVNASRRRSARRLAADLQLTVSFVETFEFCANNSQYGADCSVVPSVNFSTSSLISNVNSTAGVFVYYNLKTKANSSSWNVSVQSTDGSPSPTLYLRLNQPPDTQYYDTLAINSTVNGLLVPSSLNPANWFVGVLGTGKTFSIWFNAQCPNGCSGNGQCVPTSDASAYQCNCSDGYSLFDCSVKNDTGFKTEYIVLIVIGSIIALAALLGLVVYLYNRGRNPGDGYERI